MKQIAQLWMSGAYTEDELVSGLRITHKRFRLTLKAEGLELPTIITPSLQAEVRNNSHQYSTTGELAAVYGLTRYQAERITQSNPTMTEDKKAAIIEYAIANDCTTKEMMNKFGISRYTLKKILGDLYCPKTGGTYGTRPESDQLREQALELLASGMKQCDVAAELDVSQSYISRINPNRRSQQRRDALSDEKWSQLMACKHLYSLRTLSRLYGISKSYIVERLKREAKIQNTEQSN